MSNYKYIKQFTCELTGDKIVVVQDPNGNEIALEYMDYINNYYSEAKHDEYMYRVETGS